MITLNERKLEQLLWCNLDHIARGHSNKDAKYYARHCSDANGNEWVEFAVEYVGKTLPHETMSGCARLIAEAFSVGCGFGEPDEVVECAHNPNCYVATVKIVRK